MENTHIKNNQTRENRPIDLHSHKQQRGTGEHVFII